MRTLTNGQKLLKKWMIKHERSVAWFARLMCVSQTTAHNWIGGNSRPGFVHRKAIAILTDIHAWLLEAEEQLLEKIIERML
jgi:hypothetical protein